MASFTICLKEFELLVNIYYPFRYSPFSSYYSLSHRVKKGGGKGNEGTGVHSARWLLAS